MIALKIIALLICSIMLLFMLFVIGIILLSIYCWFSEKNDEFFENRRKELKIDDVLW